MTGATLEALTPELARSLGYNSTDGLVVSRVDDDSPAAKAGLPVGSVVVAVEGQEVHDIVHAARLLRGKGNGSRLTLDIVQVRRSGLFLRQRTGRISMVLP